MSEPRGTASDRPVRVALCGNLAPEVIERAYRMAPENAELRVADLTSDLDGALAVVAESHYIFAIPEGVPTSVVLAADHVKLIQMLSAGYDKVDTRLAIERGIPVALNGGANAPSVAEHTVLLILALYRHLVDQAILVRGGGWKGPAGSSEPNHELPGKTVGLIGVGFIGRAVAARLRGFDVKITYYDVRRMSDEEERELGMSYVDLSELLTESDVVSLHLPLLPSTKHIIGADQLATMKPSAVLVNTARGGLIDEAALTDALESGRLYGAGLDVTEEEPAPVDHPLRRLRNCLITPHTAGPTQENWSRRLDNAFANMARVERGELPEWRIPGSPERR